MRKTDYYDIMVCVDCYFAHHYGAHEHEGQWFSGESDIPSDCEPLNLIPDTAEVTDNTDSETGEGIEDFSWSRCQGCGSTLGGSRNRLAVWEVATVEVDGELITGTVYHVRDNGWPCIETSSGRQASGPEVTS